MSRIAASETDSSASCSPVGDPAAQHIDPGAGRFGHRLARQMFAQQQRQCGRNRHFFGARGAGDRITADPDIVGRIQIGAHPGIGF